MGLFFHLTEYPVYMLNGSRGEHQLSTKAPCSYWSHYTTIDTVVLSDSVRRLDILEKCLDYWSSLAVTCFLALGCETSSFPTLSPNLGLRSPIEHSWHGFNRFTPAYTERSSPSLETTSLSHSKSRFSPAILLKCDQIRHWPNYKCL